MMRLPFSAREFLGVFGRYNEAVWPAQLLFYVGAAWMLVLVLRPRQHAGRWISGMLAFFWAWMGVVYHWAFFARINPAAKVIGAFFLLQAVLFLAAGVVRPGLVFRARGGAAGIAGAALLGYALVGYPLVGLAAGHAYPETPAFGLPCPTTIFTFGILLFADGRVPLRLLTVPALWSLVGSTAAFSLGMPEDYALLVAGVLGILLGRIGSDGRGEEDQTGVGHRSVPAPRHAAHPG